MRLQITMSACPHDTANRIERWFVFTQQLTKQSRFSVRFSLALNFHEFRGMFDKLDLVYADPNNALHLVRDRDFIPLARMDGRFDEAVIVCRGDQPQALATISNQRIATCKSLIITDIAIRYLERQGLIPGELVDQPSWGAALAALLRGDADLAILYADFYYDLKPETREELLLLGESQERFAFHAFLLTPGKASLAEELRSILLTLHQNPDGAAALQALGCPKLVEASREEILSFAQPSVQ